MWGGNSCHGLIHVVRGDDGKGGGRADYAPPSRSDCTGAGKDAANVLLVTRVEHALV